MNYGKEIELDGLEKAVNQILKEYGDEATDAVEEVITEMGKEVPKKVKQAALAKGLKTKGGGKHYANGWRGKIIAKRNSVSCIIYNKDKWQLTHLLENGHAKVDGGRVEGKPHIAPVNEWAQEETYRRIVERLSK